MPACELTARPSQFLTDGGELAFRVRGREHDGRLIRIRSPKCTIGSAAGCTLRLRATGVAPVHCWVLRGSAGTIVRRLHGPAALNGGTFDESPLAIGDLLRLGVVELEVVACNEQPSAAAGEQFAVPPVDMAELEKELAAAMEKIARLEGESRQGWQSSVTAADRADQMRTALANAHMQLEDACRELTASQATIQRQADELHALRAALTAAEQANDERAEQDSRRNLENSALREEHGRCLGELSDLRTVLARTLDEQAQQTSAAQDAEQRFAKEREQSFAELQHEQQQRSELERRLERRDAELRALREEAAAQAGGMTVGMDQMRRTVDMTQVQSSSKQAELEQQRAASQAELANCRQALGEMQQALDAQRQATATLDNECAQQRAGFDQEQEQLRQQISDREHALNAARGRVLELESATSRCDDLQCQLATSQQELQTAREQLAALAGDNFTQEALAQQTAELAAAQQKLGEEQQATTARLQEREQQLEQRAGQLQNSLETAAARQAELDAERAQVDAAREELSRRAEQLAERERQAVEPVAQAPLVTQPFEHFAEPAEVEANEVADLRQQMAEAESVRKSLAEQVEALELRCRELEEQRQFALAQAAAAYCDAVPAPAPAAPQAEEEEAPVHMTAPYEPPTVEADSADVTPSVRDSDGVDSVLTRLVQSGVWRAQVKSSPAAAAPEPPPTSTADSEREDESIDNYMDRLLKRVRGESTTAAGAWKKSVEPAALPLPAPEIDAPLSSPSAESPEESPGEYIPRTTAPEQTLGLSAMRDVANDAARTAIDTHIRKHTGRQAAGRLFTALLIIVVSSVLAAWAWYGHSFVAGVGAGIGFAAGLMSTLVAVRRIASVLRLNRIAGNK